jgi:hypothetical protein
MGITIHYRGTLSGRKAYEELRRIATDYAEQRGWNVVQIDTDSAMIDLIRNNQVRTYVGPLHGVIVSPGENCESLHLVFDDEWHMEFFTKTQFAGADTHIAIIELLRQLQPLFTELNIHDEAGYWETNDREIVEQRIGRINMLLDGLQQAIPGSQIGAMIPGRLMKDLRDPAEDEEV